MNLCTEKIFEQWKWYLCLKFKEVKKQPKITMCIFDHSKSGGHFPCSFQISFSSIPTIEATILKNSLIVRDGGSGRDKIMLKDYLESPTKYICDRSIWHWHQCSFKICITTISNISSWNWIFWNRSYLASAFNCIVL